MEHRTAETIARVTEQFAQTCYQHGYGCAQSVVSHKVLPVETSYCILSPYVDKRQSETNIFVENFIKG